MCAAVGTFVAAWQCRTPGCGGTVSQSPDPLQYRALGVYLILRADERLMQASHREMMRSDTHTFDSEHNRKVSQAKRRATTKVWKQ